MKKHILYLLLLVGLTFFCCNCSKKDEEAPNPSQEYPPTASFDYSPNIGNTQTYFLFDGTGSHDNNFPPIYNLKIRWDWEGDGIWNTDWSTDRDILHVFADEGAHYVSMEVETPNGLSDTISKLVQVSNTGGWWNSNSKFHL